MCKDASRPGTAGFALVEALVSLLLLAVGLLGAGRAVVEALAAQHAALLQTRASDLASDLAETLRAASTPDGAASELASWRADALSQLPLAGAQALPFARSDMAQALPADVDIQLQWRGGSDGALIALRLPVSVRHIDEAP